MFWMIASFWFRADVRGLDKIHGTRIVAQVGDRVASPIVTGHLTRSLKELKVRVESGQVS